MREAKWLIVLLGLLPASGLACKRGVDRGEPPMMEPGSDEVVAGLLREFQTQPTEERFQRLLTRAAKSDDPAVKAIYVYDQYSKLLMPVPPKDPVDLDAVRGFLEKLKPEDWRLLEVVMRTHSLPWRRATIAQTMNRLAGPASIPALQERLSDTKEDEWVKMHVREAIANIELRATSSGSI